MAHDCEPTLRHPIGTFGGLVLFHRNARSPESRHAAYAAADPDWSHDGVTLAEFKGHLARPRHHWTSCAGGCCVAVGPVPRLSCLTGKNTPALPPPAGDWAAPVSASTASSPAVAATVP